MFGSRSPLFEFRGPMNIPVQVNSSIGLLALFILLFAMQDVLFAAIFLGALVVSVFLHELGHAWGAWIQGVPVKRIVLHGGGGFCEAQRATTRSEDEFFVAMGPIVNLTIWAVGSLFVDQVPYGPLYLAASLFVQLNLWLALFNLLPFMPLDGGRLAHLVLLRLCRPDLATRIMGGIGLIGALLWLPFMAYSLSMFGFFLLFFPPVKMHWHMLRFGRVGP